MEDNSSTDLLSETSSKDIKSYYYNCPFCEYIAQKGHVIKHLKNKKKCNIEIEDEKYLKAINEISSKKKIKVKNIIDKIVNPDILTCSYCKKSFNNKYINTVCKNNKLLEEQINSIEKIKEEITTVKQENNNLISILDNIDKTLKVIVDKETSTETHSQSHNQHNHNNNNNDNNGIINNGVIINNYHDSKDLDHISDKVILRLMGEFRNKFLEELFRLEHFNNDKPQYKNIRLSASDFKNGFIQIFENDKWKKVRIETIIPEKTDYLVLRSINAIDAFNDPDFDQKPDFKPIEKSIERVGTYLNTVDVNGDNFDKKEYENLVTDMKLTALNYTD
jgi:hypothetical protein